MTTPLRQFILKRGNIAVSSTYTGPLGEITFDTTLHALRIHDGITPGGELMPSNDTFILYKSEAGPTPPAPAAEGKLWYDNISGRLYVWYDNFWVDASPEAIYNLPAATSTELGGIKVGDNLTIDVNGVLSALPPTNLGNLAVVDQTIYGVNSNQDIVLSPNGTGAVVTTGNLQVASGGKFKIGSATIQSTDNTFQLDSNLVPSTNNLISLGQTDLRWKNVFIGPGTLYITDTVTGGDVAITAINGNVTLLGGSGLDVGQFVFYGNTIAIKDPTEEIRIGVTNATGNVVFNRPMLVKTSGGVETFGVTRNGHLLIKSGYQDPSRVSTMTIIGNDQGNFVPPANPGGMLHIVGHDNLTNRVNLDSFGPSASVWSQLNFRNADGVAANPLALQPGVMGRLQASPYLGAAYP